MKKKQIQLVINIHRGSHPKSDSSLIRRECVELGIPYITRMSSTKAAVKAIKAQRAMSEIQPKIKELQD